MSVWPTTAPLISRIPRKSNGLKSPLEDEDILQTVNILQSNVMLMITKTRILVYNFKPLAIVACHERSDESIEAFGSNVSISHANIIFDEEDGSFRHNTDTYLYYNKKTIVYVATENNYVLVYQILKNSSSNTVFHEFGLPPIVSGEYYAPENEYDDTVDDDVLTVYEKVKHSRVIQNGYATKKEKGLFQYITSSPEILEELPIKKLELRLKVVLKFDHELFDVFGYKSVSKNEKGALEDDLFILFSHGLQILRLEDFKMKETELVKINDGKKIMVIDEKFIIASYGSISNKLTLNELNLQSKTVTSKEVTTNDTIIGTFEFDNLLSIVHPKKIEYYSLFNETIEYGWNIKSEIKVCKPLGDASLLIISKTNEIYFYSKFGNVTFFNDTEETKDSKLEYNDFHYCDKKLVLVANEGYYESWSCWEIVQDCFNNFRTGKKLILANSNNDIALHSNSKDMTNMPTETLKIISLPSRTINNYFPFIRVTGDSKMLATAVVNKNILLIHNNETSTWYTIPEQIVLDLQWLGDHYLLCYVKREEEGLFLICYKIPNTVLDIEKFANYIIWEMQLSSEKKVQHLSVVTQSQYKKIIRKKKNEIDTEKDLEDLYKTAEIIICCDDSIQVIDVISSVHHSGFNIIKKFHPFIKFGLPPGLIKKKIELIFSYQNGLLLYFGNALYKLTNDDSIKLEKLLGNVESILSTHSDNIYLIHMQKFEVFQLQDLWEKKQQILSLNLDEEFYPVMVSPKSSILHGLHCMYRNNYTKLTLKNEIYLNNTIAYKLDSKVDIFKIDEDYKSLRHYKFALEKLLSQKILNRQPLDNLLELIKLQDTPPGPSGSHNNDNDMLEIVSNSLRKIEVENWTYLFTSMKLTPRDLLAMCIEKNQVKTLGILLLVFLNYNESQLVEDLKESENSDLSNSTISKSNPTENFQAKTETESLQNVLQDQKLMLEILKLLVSGASQSSDIEKASTLWDLCFQLVRLLKELDKENHTNLIQEAMKLVQSP